jgi:nicotinamide riboside transporter PnuC
MDIKLLDMISSTVVILALVLIPKNTKAWLLYSLGCFTYIYINTKMNLHGQAMLNVVAAGIAINNYVKLRREKTDSA